MFASSYTDRSPYKSVSSNILQYINDTNECRWIKWCPLLCLLFVVKATLSAQDWYEWGTLQLGFSQLKLTLISQHINFDAIPCFRCDDTRMEWESEAESSLGRSQAHQRDDDTRMEWESEAESSLGRSQAHQR